MKAIVHDTYGSFDVLAIRDIEKPVVKDDEVLIRVRAAGLHIGDCFGVRGAPFVMRLAAGLFKPKHGIPGFDVAGQVEAVGQHVTRFRAGDHVIDYSQEDFTLGGRRYDLVFDNVENRSLSDCRRVLTSTGTLILNSGTGARGIRMLVRLVKPLLLSPFVRQRLRRYLSVPNEKDLVILKELLEGGKLKPMIDSTYPLHEVPAALRYIEAGHARGKVVITVMGEA
jgi:NADPH:quinone reductase-like Zn-dependent oxidoreductase